MSLFVSMIMRTFVDSVISLSSSNINSSASLRPLLTLPLFALLLTPSSSSSYFTYFTSLHAPTSASPQRDTRDSPRERVRGHPYGGDGVRALLPAHLPGQNERCQ